METPISGFLLAWFGLYVYIVLPLSSLLGVAVWIMVGVKLLLRGASGKKN